ncbi:MAG: hypothetical protein LWX11_11745, partial [Firmicutes bacterium]|nr:hypothetical protein [Bacillota bacterium]
MAIQDLFRRHREKATGLWKLGLDPNRTIFFDRGDIVFAQSSHPSDRLTHILVERGKLTQAQMDYALANLKTGMSIGKNLIEMGFITQRDLLDVARAQVERVVAGALATFDEMPVFEAGELDPHVVRLPFDTPELLLNSLLGLKDRENLLELLGPLNQVVVLEGRRLLEMNLPADLAKLPPLLDGSHTLLELSRESLAEPLRLGTFALFLREMGWARLHEMPPLDKGSLDMALTPEPEPLSALLPEPQLETVPSLFSSIHAAAKPTTNLEHLSQALDESLNSWEETAPIPDFEVATGQAVLASPGVRESALPAPLPEKAEGRLPEPQEPPVIILPSTLTEPEAPAPSFQEEISEPSSGRRWGLGLLFLAALAGFGGFFAWKQWGQGIGNEKRPEAPTVRPLEVPATAAQAKPAKESEKPVPELQASGEKAAPEKPVSDKPSADKPAPKVEAKVEPRVEPKVGAGAKPEERVAALRAQKIDLAVKQGEAYVAKLSKNQWTLRLEIACQHETMAKAVAFFGA